MRAPGFLIALMLEIAAMVILAITNLGQLRPGFTAFRRQFWRFQRLFVVEFDSGQGRINCQADRMGHDRRERICDLPRFGLAVEIGSFIAGSDELPAVGKTL